MARAADCGLQRLFDGLLRSEGGHYEKVDDFSFYEEGGYSATIRGESVLLGTASFMRKMEVRLPGGINLRTGIFLAMDQNSSIFDIVSYAWAGFGAAFGPALLMSLFWRHTTKYGVLVGIIVGGVTVLVWKQYALFGLYEIVPGFLFSTIAIWAVSWLDRVPEASILETFDKVGKSKI